MSNQVGTGNLLLKAIAIVEKEQVHVLLFTVVSSSVKNAIQLSYNFKRMYSIASLSQKAFSISILGQKRIKMRR